MFYSLVFENKLQHYWSNSEYKMDSAISPLRSVNNWSLSKSGEHLVNNIVFCLELYMRTLARVSGSRRPTKPPPTNTDDASRMGMALVMPTSDPKIRLPSTAASLHKALQKPKPVPLKTEGHWKQCCYFSCSLLCLIWKYTIHILWSFAFNKLILTVTNSWIALRLFWNYELIYFMFFSP